MSPLPSVTVSTRPLEDLDVDVLVAPVFRGAIEGPGTEDLFRALGLDAVPRDSGFRGHAGETLQLGAPGLPTRRVLLVGLGRMDELDDEQLRRAAGTAAQQLLASAESVATSLALVNPSPASLRAVAEGFLLGAYRYDQHRSEPDPRRLSSVTLVIPSTLEDEAGALVARAALHARAQWVARDLVNTPAKDKSPDVLAQRAIDVLPAQVDVEIWDEARIKEERCGGLLAVGRGSSRPPRMLVMRYEAEEPVASVALVGKGIVFDSGGLSLKRPNEHMTWMKADMGGAAAVIGAMSAMAELRMPVSVLGVCALAENMPSGSAQRPGDVMRARNGTTVEVRNTDAEGRLVLADALSWVAEQEVDAIVDLATLTGSAMHAVGRRATGVFGNDDDLLRQLLTAAGDAGEPTWHLPLWEDLRENLDSEVADIDNLGRGDLGGATMAGLFLREFVDDIPWVHLDIAGAAWGEKARHHLPKQGTGTGVRTILRWLEQAEV